MPSLNKFVLYCFFPALFALTSTHILSAQSQATSLGAVARELRAEKNTQHPDQSPPPSQDSSLETAAAIVNDPPEIQRFVDQTRVLLLREQFAELDKIAAEARSTKARFPGGGWKLSRFFEALKSGNGGSIQSDADWQNHLALMQRWVTARPQSITARVALADAYIDYAWAARGHGYSNTVTDQAWQMFDERAKNALKILEDSASLTPKCPHWFLLMQRVAQALGADHEQERAIFEKAVAFEPLYFGYYQLYAITLLPKWGGEPGETEAFAEQTYRHIGGKQGAYIYFEIASNLCGSCGEFAAEGYSWPKLQEGFAALEEMYGLTPLKLNRFAFLAAAYGDKAVAAKAFARVGPNWDAHIWGSRSRFESQRVWAGLPAAPPPRVLTGQSVPYVQPPARNNNVEERIQLAFKEKNAHHWTESNQLAQEAIKIAEPLPGTADQLGRAYLLMADNEYSAGHVPEALRLLDRAVSSASEKAGPNALELANVLSQTAMHAEGMNDYARAEANLRRGIEIREKANAPSDRELCNQLTILGILLQTRGRDKEAMDVYQRAIRNREAINPDDIALMQPLEQLGLVLEKMGRYQEAETAFLHALKVIEGFSGLNNSALTDPLSKLANLYRVAGRTEDERRMQERLQKIQANATN